MIEPAVRAQILSSTGVTALIGSGNTGRAYDKRLPEGATLPAVTYQQISRDGFPDYDGVTQLARTRVQVDCWHTNGQGAADLAQVVRHVLDGFKGTVASTKILASFLLDEESGFEVETGLHRYRQDFQISYHDVIST